jgi:hypothetical protein
MDDDDGFDVPELLVTDKLVQDLCSRKVCVLRVEPGPWSRVLHAVGGAC